MLEFFFIAGLFAPGFFLVQMTSLKNQSLSKQAFFSYVASLVIMFLVLYAGCILLSFTIASYSYALLVVLSLIFIVTKHGKRITSSWLSQIRFHNISRRLDDIVFSISVLSLCLVYCVILLTRGLLDSDVVQYYLPFSREIVRNGGFTYSTGYDYNLFLKPIGISVIYAWTYVISGSMISEAFRLMPIVPVLLMVFMVRSIGEDATGSHYVGNVAGIVFILLPFHDRLLTYNAFYPDVFYYPLIFFAILGLINYSKDKNLSLLIWIGCAFGVAGLLKAQTILLFIAFFLCIAAIEIKCNKLVYILCIFTPIAVLIPNILAQMNSNGINFSIPPESASLLLFSSLLAGALFFFLQPNNVDAMESSREYNVEYDDIEKKSESSSIAVHATKIRSSYNATIRIVKCALLLLVPFVALSSIWYINNLLRYGSLLYTSSVGIPNYDWAINILKSISLPGSGISYVYYVPYVFLLFLNPAVMGYVWLIPLLSGLAIMLYKKRNTQNLLLFYSIMFILLVFSQIAIGISPYGISVANPRDLLPIAPLLSVIVANALCSLSLWQSAPKASNHDITLAVFLAACFGFASYIHSVYLYFGTIILPTLTRIISLFLSVFGLTLQQTTYQLSPFDRIVNMIEHFNSIVAISLFAAIPFIFIALLKIKSTYSGSDIAKKLRSHVSNWTNQIPHFINRPLFTERTKTVTEGIGLIAIVVSVIVVPRGIILAAQGGPLASGEYQLSHYYGDIYDLILNHSSVIHGDILTYAAPAGLQYYISNVRIIDISYAANLAHLKDCFNSSSPYSSAMKLRQTGIRHILLNPNTFSPIDIALNHTLSNITNSDDLALESQHYGDWVLYDLGPFEISKTIMPLENWLIDSRYSVGSGSFVVNDTGAFLQLNTSATGNRIAIANYMIPQVDIADYNYLLVNFTATDNVRILIRFYLKNGTPLDLAYWTPPSQVEVLNFRTIGSGHLRGDAYISIVSDNDESAYAQINEVAILKYIAVSNKVIIPFDNWHVDYRFTSGPFTFSTNESICFLEMLSGSSDDELVISSNEFPHLNSTNFNFLRADITGTRNAMILFRIYLENGTSLDLAYWVAPFYVQSIIRIPLSNVPFRGDAFIGLMSSNGQPCSISIHEISLLTVD
jgi:hypothetical protein